MRAVMNLTTLLLDATALLPIHQGMLLQSLALKSISNQGLDHVPHEMERASGSLIITSDGVIKLQHFREEPVKGGIPDKAQLEQSEPKEVIPYNLTGKEPVFVLDKHGKPLMPTIVYRMWELLKKGRAVIHLIYPLTIRLKDRLVENSTLQPIALKWDPGSKTHGLAITRLGSEISNKLFFDTNGKIIPTKILKTETILFLAEIELRGWLIKKNLDSRRACRRNRRTRNTRYRSARYNNRAASRRKGRLGPSVQHRIDVIKNWTIKLRKLCPITEIHNEKASFDTQKMDNPYIKGLDYQNGTLKGYETRLYVLERDNYKCVYCGSNEWLEIDHIIPKSKGGTNRVSNLVCACHRCNQSKDNKTVQEFLKNKPDVLTKVLAQVKKSLRDAGIMNSIKNGIVRTLEEFGLPVYNSYGYITKYTRKRLNVPKTHCLDAALVGGKMDKIYNTNMRPLLIKAIGRGNRQKATTNKYGFPIKHNKRNKKVNGFKTGDIVKAKIVQGKSKGTYIGRAVVFENGQVRVGGIINANWKNCKIIQLGNGYSYKNKE